MSQGNTDNDYNSDDEIFYEDDEIFYEADEVSATKYNIILCELFNELIHGKSNSVVVKHYLNICSLKDLDIQIINEMKLITCLQ